MMQVFEVRSPKGILRQEYYADTDVNAMGKTLENNVNNEEWYQIKHHECFHDEEKPCNSWNVIAEKGEIPQD